MKLKNVSNKTFSIAMTENPITKPQQFAMTDEVLEGGIIQKDLLKKQIAKKPNLKDKLSVRVEVVMKPDEIVEFGEDKKYNEEQGKFVYKLISSGWAEEYAGGPEVVPPIVEIDDEGDTIKGPLYNQYRKRPSGISVNNPQTTDPKQFLTPEQQNAEVKETK